MITKPRPGVALALILAVGSSARAADETAVVTRATKLLEEISSDPESGIPPRFLQEAKGILIVPHIVESQLGVGRKKGHGVFLARQENGAWGHPELVTISGRSVGAEAGRMVSDMVMIYRTRGAADQHTEQFFTFSLALHVYVSLRHPHEFSGPGPNSKTKKDVLTYTRQRGILVGAEIGGEHMRNPAPAHLDLKTPPTAVRPSVDTDTEVTVQVTKPDAPVPNADAKPASDSREVARLKTVLTALTNSPPARVAATGTKDPNVSPASGTKPRAETGVSPR